MMKNYSPQALAEVERFLTDFVALLDRHIAQDPRDGGA